MTETQQDKRLEVTLWRPLNAGVAWISSVLPTPPESWFINNSSIINVCGAKMLLRESMCGETKSL